jgi:protease I
MPMTALSQDGAQRLCPASSRRSTSLITPREWCHIAIENARGFVRHFRDTGKPIAAICHAPWALIEADAVRSRTLTSWPSLKTDLRNAGVTWVDREVVVDGNLVTSRKPDDLPAFCAKMIEVSREARSPSAAHARRA